MQDRYYIIYNPSIYNIMDLIGTRDFTPADLLGYISNRDVSRLTPENYLDYLRFDLRKERRDLMQEFGWESYAAYYIANQIAKADLEGKVFMADDYRKTIPDIVSDTNRKPIAVFITCVSCNFATAVCTAIALNYAKIPVIIGGVHVSTSKDDIDTYIRKYVLHPDMVSQVIGAGDSEVIKEIIEDLTEKCVKKYYEGKKYLENNVWGGKNVVLLPDMDTPSIRNIPVIGRWLNKCCKTNVIAPHLGCPYNCNFCSLGSLPESARSFIIREPEDFVNELMSHQKNGVSLKNRHFLFLPDNLLLGGQKLEEIADRMINTNLKINYFAQSSIEIAYNEKLLNKLRLSGASGFMIGLESLDIRNLDFINKNVTKAIKKSGKTASEYYSALIKKIQKHGFWVFGSFIFGLPYDYFNSLHDHSGRDVADFCIKNNICLQATSFVDLPGSKNFDESQANGNYLYGKKGTMDYLLSLPATDFTESNRKVPISLKESSLLVSYMLDYASTKVYANIPVIRNAFYNSINAWKSPTNKGYLSVIERLFDAFSAWWAQFAVPKIHNRHHKLLLGSRNGYRGSTERLYDWEKNPEVRKVFKDYVEKFR
jgi:hypothetical protein